MNNSIARYRQNTSLVYLAGITRAVELGFIAAGVTVCVVAVAETLHTLVNWFTI